MNDNSDPLLLPSEVRQLVRLSDPTIYRMRRKNKFPEPLGPVDGSVRDEGQRIPKSEDL